MGLGLGVNGRGADRNERSHARNHKTERAAKQTLLADSASHPAWQHAAIPIPA